MSDTVIKVENLSKKYMLSHQRPERYTALRDVVANGVKKLGRKILSPFSNSTFNSQPPTTEDFFALQDVSFEIKQSDRVGIIGRNGAGKSTLLKILSRITEPTSGRIEITGRVASLLEVGTGFHPELTGRENIFLNGAILGMGREEIKRKFDEIVAFAEVEKFLDTPVKRYSSGMYVRLAFAIAAHLEPEILIVDEVLAVGDVQFQKKCLGKMHEVSESGRTVMFVSHNMSAVAGLCNKGILLTSGKIDYSGDIDDAINKYISVVNTSDAVSTINYYNNKVKIEQISINGNYGRSIHMKYSENTVSITMLVNIIVDCKISVEAKLYDMKGNAIAIFSPGHINLNIIDVKKGKFNISTEILLPNMTKGDYYLDIYLLSPGYEFYCVINSAVMISKESILVKSCSGGVFENRLGHGSVILDGSVKLEV